MSRAQVVDEKCSCQSDCGPSMTTGRKAYLIIGSILQDTAGENLVQNVVALDVNENLVLHDAQQLRLRESSAQKGGHVVKSRLHILLSRRFTCQQLFATQQNKKDIAEALLKGQPTSSTTATTAATASQLTLLHAFSTFAESTSYRVTARTHDGTWKVMQ